MEYRRFGKTEKEISVITLGGMRFKHGWDDPRDELPEDSIQNCFEITKMAFDYGINHIETAYGYSKSEGLFGTVLPQLKKRNEYFLMTKGAADTPDEFKRRIEEQLKVLKTDYFDFYAYHGINLQEHLDLLFQKDGMMKVLRDYNDQGIIKHIGFSTHGRPEVVVKAIETGAFEFVNLHHYYFYQKNLEALRLAKARDMGVLIISPNDKGGQLWNASEKVKKACKPLTPIQFNGRFCLSDPGVTTLTMGFHEPNHFNDPMGILDADGYNTPLFYQIREKMNRIQADVNENYCTLCGKCLPCPENINIPEVLRMWNMNKYYDMLDFGLYRYNMFEPEGHWFPGNTGNACTECGECLPRCPEKLDIPALVKEAHRVFYKEKTE